jgi:hypothetical protein
MFFAIAYVSVIALQNDHSVGILCTLSAKTDFNVTFLMTP